MAVKVLIEATIKMLFLSVQGQIFDAVKRLRT